MGRLLAIGYVGGRLLAVAAAMTVVGAMALFDVVTVSGISMEGTFRDGDRVLVLRTAMLSHLPIVARRVVQKGSVVVFPHPLADRQMVVKRIVGVAGDRLRLNAGALIVNDRLQPEERSVRPSRSSWPEFPKDANGFRVPDGHYFVLSDNRVTALDSRVFGPVRTDAVHGVVVGTLTTRTVSPSTN